MIPYNSIWPRTKNNYEEVWAEIEDEKYIEQPKSSVFLNSEISLRPSRIEGQEVRFKLEKFYEKRIVDHNYNEADTKCLIMTFQQLN